MALFVEVQVDLQRNLALRALRNADGRSALVHLGDDPVAVEGLVGQDRIEGDAVDQRGDADRVTAVAGKQHEAHKVAQGIGQGEDLGRPAALRLADGLTSSPPFEPCPWR